MRRTVVWIIAVVVLLFLLMSEISAFGIMVNIILFPIRIIIGVIGTLLAALAMPVALLLSIPMLLFIAFIGMLMLKGFRRSFGPEHVQ